MAHAYVDHGVAAGNVLMKQFDLDAEALSDLTTKLDDLASRAADDSARYVQSEAEAQEALARSVYQASVVAGSLLSLLCAAARRDAAVWGRASAYQAERGDTARRGR